jgi:hypothetical protein
MSAKPTSGPREFPVRPSTSNDRRRALLRRDSWVEIDLKRSFAVGIQLLASTAPQVGVPGRWI